MNWNDTPEEPRTVICPHCGGTQINKYGQVCRKCDGGEVFDDEDPTDRIYDKVDELHSEGRLL